jgi:hypothetical protein
LPSAADNTWQLCAICLPSLSPPLFLPCALNNTWQTRSSCAR